MSRCNTIGCMAKKTRSRLLAAPTMPADPHPRPRWGAAYRSKAVSQSCIGNKPPAPLRTPLLAGPDSAPLCCFRGPHGDCPLHVGAWRQHGGHRVQRERVVRRGHYGHGAGVEVRNNSAAAPVGCLSWDNRRTMQHKRSTTQPVGLRGRRPVRPNEVAPYTHSGHVTRSWKQPYFASRDVPMPLPPPPL